MKVWPSSSPPSSAEGGGRSAAPSESCAKLDIMISTKYADKPAPASDSSLSLPMSSTNALKAARSMTDEKTKQQSMSPNASTKQALGRSLTRRGEGKISRAYYGTLLSIIEQPKFENRCLQATTNYAWPLLEMAIEFFQLSLFNTYVLPPGVPLPRQVLRAIMQAVVVLQSTYGLSRTVIITAGIDAYLLTFLISVAIVAAIVLSLLILALQFSGRQQQQQLRRGASSPTNDQSGERFTCSSLLIRPLSAYVDFVSGALYIPLINLLSFYFFEAVGTSVSTAGVLTYLRAAVALLCLLFLIPFVLFVSQNQGYIRDEHAFHLFKRRHNRLNLLVIIVKSVGTITFRAGLDGFSAAWTNLALFIALVLAHLLTNVYYHANVNRGYAGLYAGLLLGAVCRLLTIIDFRGMSGSLADETYWYLLGPVFVIGWLLQWLSERLVFLHHWRYSINTFLVAQLSLLDLADNSTIIYRYDLSWLLRSATRLGSYARFLAENDPDDPKTERLFTKALKLEPANAEILGGFADYLLTKAGRETEAAALYLRAVNANADNRDNLEGYALLLSEKNSPEALYYYQRSLLGYHEHYGYRDLYANSLDPMMILDSYGNTVLDCNGATLLFFRARKRQQVCGRPGFLLELVHPSHLENFKQRLKDVARKGGLNTTTFEGRMCTFNRLEVPVQMLLSRVQHGSKNVLQLTIKDMTAIRIINERCSKLELKSLQLDVMHKITNQSEHRQLSRYLFENAATCQLLATHPGAIIERYSIGAERVLGFSRQEIIGAPLSTLLPAEMLIDFMNALPIDIFATLSLRSSASAKRGPEGRNFTAEGASAMSLQHELSRDVTISTASGMDKTFMAKLSPVALGGDPSGHGARSYILVCMNEVTRFFPQPDPSEEVSLPTSASAPLSSSTPAPNPRFATAAALDSTFTTKLTDLLLQESTQPIIMTDDRGVRIHRLSPAAAAFLGYSAPADAVGTDLHELVAEEALPSHPDHVTAVSDSKTATAASTTEATKADAAIPQPTTAGSKKDDDDGDAARTDKGNDTSGPSIAAGSRVMAFIRKDGTRQPPIPVDVHDIRGSTSSQRMLLFVLHPPALTNDGSKSEHRGSLVIVAPAPPASDSSKLQQDLKPAEEHRHSPRLPSMEKKPEHHEGLPPHQEQQGRTPRQSTPRQSLPSHKPAPQQEEQQQHSARRSSSVAPPPPQQQQQPQHEQQQQHSARRSSSAPQQQQQPQVPVEPPTPLLHVQQPTPRRVSAPQQHKQEPLPQQQQQPTPREAEPQQQTPRQPQPQKQEMQAQGRPPKYQSPPRRGEDVVLRASTGDDGSGGNSTDQKVIADMVQRAIEAYVASSAPPPIVTQQNQFGPPLPSSSRLQKRYSWEQDADEEEGPPFVWQQQQELLRQQVHQQLQQQWQQQQRHQQAPPSITVVTSPWERDGGRQQNTRDVETGGPYHQRLYSDILVPPSLQGSVPSSPGHAAFYSQRNLPPSLHGSTPSSPAVSALRPGPTPYASSPAWAQHGHLADRQVPPSLYGSIPSSPAVAGMRIEPMLPPGLAGSMPPSPLFSAFRPPERSSLAGGTPFSPVKSSAYRPDIPLQAQSSVGAGGPMMPGLQQDASSSSMPHPQHQDAEYLDTLQAYEDEYSYPPDYNVEETFYHSRPTTPAP